MNHWIYMVAFFKKYPAESARFGPSTRKSGSKRDRLRKQKRKERLAQGIAS